MQPPSFQATELINKAAGGNTGAAGDLLNLLYDELRRVASGILGEGHAAPTLQPTLLVHEAWLRLVDQQHLQEGGREHFIRTAARAMRFVVIDHVRARRRDKRGGGASRVPMDDFVDYYSKSSVDLVALDEALKKLQDEDEQLARIIELRFFAGLTIEETAKLLDVSTPTVERGWRFAKAYLQKQLG